MRRMLMASAVGHVFVFIVLVVFSALNLGYQRPKLRRFIRVHTVTKSLPVVAKTPTQPVVKTEPKKTAAPTPKPTPKKKIIQKPKKTAEKKPEPTKTPVVKKKPEPKPTPIPKPKTEKKPAEPKKTPKPIATAEPTPRELAKAEPPSLPKTPVTYSPPSATSPAPPESIIIEELPLPAYYLEAVRARIESNFKVPERFKGLPVKCRVGFTVLRDGTITNIKLLESSKVEALDLTAIQSLENAKQVGPLPDSYRENSVIMTITFDFKI